MTPLEVPHKPRRRPRTPSLCDEIARTCRLMDVALATTFAVSVAELHSPLRCRAEVAFARQIAIYLAHVMLGMSYSAAGRMFRRDRTTAAYACRMVEERRDDPAVDRLLEMLEGVCCDIARWVLALPPVRP